MMTVKELKEILSRIPDDAIIYVEADHGQQPEQADIVYMTNEEFEEKAPYYGEDLDWEDVEDIKKFNKITAVLIG